jgi:hypothetical protein
VDRAAAALVALVAVVAQAAALAVEVVPWRVKDLMEGPLMPTMLAAEVVALLAAEEQVILTAALKIQAVVVPQPCYLNGQMPPQLV